MPTPPAPATGDEQVGCLRCGYSGTVSEMSWHNIAYTDTVAVGFASVPDGPNGNAVTYPITVSLTLNGGQIASGSGSVCVGNGC